jgi:two-component system phosphate regulon sensor histidine kinase PhoR
MLIKVKNGSIFIKRITFAREIMEARPDLRTTSINISVPTLLMVSSILLLLVLQFLWLKSAYNEAKDTFQNATNILFRNTIFALDDSIAQQNIQPVSSDSLSGGNHMYMKRFSKRLHPVDSASEDLAIRQAFVEVFVSPENKDSIQDLLKPLSTRIRTGKTVRQYVIRLGPDSLRKDTVIHHFSKALAKSGISIPFRIHLVQAKLPGRVSPVLLPSGDIVSDLVPMNPLHHYAVSFPDTKEYFFRQITPQILFSVFLTLLTAGSFLVMNHSIQSQNRLMKLKNDFISNMTHELKTPVSTVSVALEALEKFKALDDHEKTSEYLQIAQTELSRLVLMTDMILQTASFENRDPELSLRQMDMDALVNEVLDSLKLVFEKRGATVTYERKGTNFSIIASHAHLCTVLYNLLDNAIKYSGNAPVVIIQLDGVATDEIILSVKDNGIGISNEYREKVFEKFFRVPSGDVHNVKGYGLGLNYVASVISHHQGEILVESETGKGTCFKIRLPRNGQRK